MRLREGWLEPDASSCSIHLCQLPRSHCSQWYELLRLWWVRAEDFFYIRHQTISWSCTNKEPVEAPRMICRPLQPNVSASVRGKWSVPPTLRDLIMRDEECLWWTGIAVDMRIQIVPLRFPSEHCPARPWKRRLCVPQRRGSSPFNSTVRGLGLDMGMLSGRTVCKLEIAKHASNVAEGDPETSRISIKGVIHGNDLFIGPSKRRKARFQHGPVICPRTRHAGKSGSGIPIDPTRQR